MYGKTTLRTALDCSRNMVAAVRGTKPYTNKQTELEHLEAAPKPE